MTIQRLRKAIPDISDDLYFSQAIVQGIKGFSLSFSTITADFVREAHAHLVSVVAWTVSAEDIANINGIGKKNNLKFIYFLIRN
jgi:hypothetical protein